MPDRQVLEVTMELQEDVVDTLEEVARKTSQSSREDVMFASPLNIWPETVLTIKSNWSLTFSNTIAVTTCNEKQ